MRHIITLVTFLLAAPWAFAGKVDSISAYVRNIAYFNRFYPQEKVYIHMDNRSYFLGDTIWFKAYVVEANTHELTTMSKILYVELLNESGVLLECKKLQIVDGMCHGEFALDEEYRTGYYELRAYTRYMLNFGNNKDEIKRKNVTVGMEGSVSSDGGGSGGSGGSGGTIAAATSQNGNAHAQCKYQAEELRLSHWGFLISYKFYCNALGQNNQLNHPLSRGGWGQEYLSAYRQGY